MEFNTWKEVNKNWSQKYNWNFEKQLEETWKEAQKEIKLENKEILDEADTLRAENEHLKYFIAEVEQKLKKINYDYLNDAQYEVEQLSNLCKGKSI